MQRKKILVPLGKHAKNFKSVHYALSLAGRIQAQILIIRERERSDGDSYNFELLDQSLNELIDNARQKGFRLSLYHVERNFVSEIVELANAEHIDLLIFNTDDEISEPIMTQVKPLVSGQIIQVREKQ